MPHEALSLLRGWGVVTASRKARLTRLLVVILLAGLALGAVWVGIGFVRALGCALMLGLPAECRAGL